jgi:hypothetical protein
MSHGVTLVRRPRRATTIHPAQMQAAPRPQNAPRVYSAEVRFDIELIGLGAVELSRPPTLLRPPDFRRLRMIMPAHSAMSAGGRRT